MSYSGDDGTFSWSGPWLELGEGNGATDGAVQVGNLDSLPAPGMAVWSGTSTPQYSRWNGTSFGQAASAVPMDNRWRIMAGAAAPTRDEVIVVGVEAGRPHRPLAL